MVTEGIEPSTVALLAQRSNQLSYATSLTKYTSEQQNTSCIFTKKFKCDYLVLLYQDEFNKFSL